MGTNAADIQEKQLKAQAKATKKYAISAQASGMEEAKDITQESNSALSQAIAMLGKTGAIGVESNKTDLQSIETGVDTGSLKGDAVTELEKNVAKRENKFEIDENGKVKINEDAIMDVKNYKEYKEDKEALSILTQGLDEIGDIETSDIGDLTSGTTALNLKTFQDKLTKARNKYVNQVQEDVYTAIESAESASAQANLAGQASTWSNITSILDIGFGAANILGWFE